jgi:hypothetical protein
MDYDGSGDEKNGGVFRPVVFTIAYWGMAGNGMNDMAVMTGGVDGEMMRMPRRTGILLARRWDCPGEQLSGWW